MTPNGETLRRQDTYAPTGAAELLTATPTTPETARRKETRVHGPFEFYRINTAAKKSAKMAEMGATW